MRKRTGKEIIHVMRTNGITIARAAELFDITKKRVRQVRQNGVQGDLLIWEWTVWLPKTHKEYS